jgi:hypothetical protein
MLAGASGAAKSDYLVNSAFLLERIKLPRFVIGRITVAEGSRLAKKPNYDFEKRRKEMDRKAKKDAKREERLQRRRDGLPDEVEPAEGDAPDADADVTEAPAAP